MWTSLPLQKQGVQWTGPSPAQDPADWQEIAYKHDVAGRRVEKRFVVSSSDPSYGYSMEGPSTEFTLSAVEGLGTPVRARLRRRARRIRRQ